MRVLIADDEPRVRSNLERMVGSLEGFAVEGMATDGQEALDMLRGGGYDMLITDIRMPRLSGLDLIQQIRQLNEPVGCLIISGYDDFAYARSAMRLGIRHYLLKPVDADELREALGQIRHELEEIRRTRSLLGGRAVALQERALLRLLHGQDMQSDVTALGIAGGSYVLYIMELRAEEPVSISDDLVGLRDENHIAVLLNEERLAVLSLKQEDAGKQAQMYLEMLSRDGTAARVVCADGLASVQDIYDAYRKIRRLLESAWLIHGQNPAFLSDISFEINPHALEALHKWDHTPLDEAIRGRNLQEIDRQVERFSELLGDVGADDVAVRSYFVEAVMHTMKLVTDTGGDADRILDGTHNLPQMMNTFSMGDLQAWYLSVCRSIADYLQGMKRTRNRKVSEQILDLFKADPSGSYGLEELARRLFMSPAYLGQLFKKETGESLHAYLTRERIRMSLDLLANTEMAVYEVAVAVGYQNLRSFYTAFRKAEGCTPNEYREQYRSGMTGKGKEN